MGSTQPRRVMASEIGAEIVETIYQATVTGWPADGPPLRRGTLRRYHADALCQRLFTEGRGCSNSNARFGDPDGPGASSRLEDDLCPILAAGASGHFAVAEHSTSGTRLPPASSSRSPATPAGPGPGRGDRRGSDRASSAQGVQMFTPGRPSWATSGAAPAAAFLNGFSPQAQVSSTT